MRQIIIGKLIALLQEHGFLVSSFLHGKNCFDLIAKRSRTSLIVKIFENVDALRPEQAEELKKLSNVFHSIPLVVGQKTKAFALQDNVIYNRYNISVVNYVTLKNFLNGKIPEISYFKGKEIVELNSKKLKDMRNKRELSFNELANKLNTTVESLYRYERGAKASLSMAKKLENFFNTSLIKEIDLFERKETKKLSFDEQPTDDVLKKMYSLGMKMTLFRHAPFKAFSNTSERVLINKGKTKTEIKKKALAMRDAKSVLDSHSVIITKDFDKKSFAHSALVEEEELESFSKVNELLNLIREREKTK